MEKINIIEKRIYHESPGFIELLKDGKSIYNHKIVDFFDILKLPYFDNREIGKEEIGDLFQLTTDNLSVKEQIDEHIKRNTPKESRNIFLMEYLKKEEYQLISVFI
jgi:hypothetical protein